MRLNFEGESEMSHDYWMDLTLNIVIPVPHPHFVFGENYLSSQVNFISVAQNHISQCLSGRYNLCRIRHLLSFDHHDLHLCFQGSEIWVCTCIDWFCYFWIHLLLHLSLSTSCCRSNANLDAAIVTSDLQPTWEWHPENRIPVCICHFQSLQAFYQISIRGIEVYSEYLLKYVADTIGNNECNFISVMKFKKYIH